VILPDKITVNNESLEATFDKGASQYDLNGVFRDAGRRLVDLLPVNPRDNILDIATGAGAVLIPAAKRAAHVTGIDISNGMLERAKQAATAENLRNVALIKMDGGNLEFRNDSFDIVTCAFGIFFLPESALRGVYRVCKPGGYIGLAVFDKTVTQVSGPGDIFGQLAKEYGIEFNYSSTPLPPRFSPEEIAALVTSHGFRDVETVQESRETVSPSFEDYWEIAVSGGNRLVIMSMDETTRSLFKSELFERMKSITKPDGIRSVFAVMYVTGRK
jgi:ubiquinone/menaquinone biosynthesis C-methylase UbiE